MAGISTKFTGVESYPDPTTTPEGHWEKDYLLAVWRNGWLVEGVQNPATMQYDDLWATRLEVGQAPQTLRLEGVWQVDVDLLPQEVQSLLDEDFYDLSKTEA